MIFRDLIFQVTQEELLIKRHGVVYEYHNTTLPLCGYINSYRHIGYYNLTSTSHKALLDVADVAEVLAVNLRKTTCFFLYSSIVRNFSCSAWNNRTTSPPFRMLSSFSRCSRNKEIFHDVWVFTTFTYFKIRSLISDVKESMQILWSEYKLFKVSKISN